MCYPSGRITFRMRISKNRTAKLGVFGPGLTTAAARERARTLKGDPDAAVRYEKITLRRYVDEIYGPSFLLTHKPKNLNNLNVLEMDDEYLSAFTSDAVQKWVEKRLAVGIKPATINRNLAALNAVLNHAVKKGWLAKNPIKTGRDPVEKLPAGDSARNRHLDAKELKRFLAALDTREKDIRKWRPNTPKKGFADVVKPLVLVALYSGARFGELADLKWGDVQGESITLRTRKSKGAVERTRHVKLPPPALAALKQWRKQVSCQAEALVFPSGHGGGRITEIRKSWAKILKLAKIKNFHVHDMRHHRASTLAMAGVSLQRIAEVLGHTDMAMTRRYAHLSREQLDDTANIY